MYKSLLLVLLFSFILIGVVKSEYCAKVNSKESKPPTYECSQFGQKCVTGAKEILVRSQQNEFLMDYDKVNKRLVFAMQVSGEPYKRVISVSTHYGSYEEGIQNLGIIYGDNSFGLAAYRYLGVQYVGTNAVGTTNGRWCARFLYSYNQLSPKCTYGEEVNTPRFVFEEGGINGFYSTPSNVHSLYYDNNAVFYKGHAQQLRLDGNNLYLKFGQYIYLGNTTNKNSSIHLQTLPVFFNFGGYIHEFEISHSNVFINTGTSIERFTILNGVVDFNSKKVLFNGAPLSIQYSLVYIYGQYMEYINFVHDQKIYQVPTYPKNPDQPPFLLFDPNINLLGPGLCL